MVGELPGGRMGSHADAAGRDVDAHGAVGAAVGVVRVPAARGLGQVSAHAEVAAGIGRAVLAVVHPVTVVVDLDAAVGVLEAVAVFGLARAGVGRVERDPLLVRKQRLVHQVRTQNLTVNWL